ncbi:unnamed protein product [Rhizophagus irregularis]|nr:unnamed protein product [Rhizophagus irregularis]
MVPGHTTMLKSLPRVSKSTDFNSKIFNKEQFVIIANLIDKKDDESAYIINIPYNFKLDYRLKCDAATGLIFFKQYKRNNNSPFVILFNFRDKNSKEHCIGGYFHNNGDKNGKGFTFRIGGMNIVNFVIDEIGVDFCGVRNSEGEVSLEIFRVKKVTITNTLKAKDEVSLIRKVTNKIFGKK